MLNLEIVAAFMRANAIAVVSNAWGPRAGRNRNMPTVFMVEDAIDALPGNVAKAAHKIVMATAVYGPAC